MKFTTGNLIIVFIAYAIFRNSIGKNAGWLFSLVRKYKLFIISAFLAFLPYLIWSQIFYGSFFYTIVYAILVVSDFNEPVTFYFSKFIEMFSFIVVIGFALSIIAVLYDLKKSKKWDKDILVLFVWIVFFILFISLGAHKELRYMIPLAAPVIILAGYGFSRIMERKEISHIILFVIVLFSVISFSPSFARLNEPFINMGKSEEVMASEFIRDNIPQDYVIYANSNYPIFGYYTRYKLQPLWIWDDSFFENYRETMTEDGIVIVYKDRKYPGTVWAENAPETSKIEEYTDFIIYRYDV